MSGPVHVSALIAGYLNGLHDKKQTKWHFELHDGKGGIIICPSQRQSKRLSRHAGTGSVRTD